MAIGDIEARMVLRDEQFQRAIDRVESRLGGLAKNTAKMTPNTSSLDKYMNKFQGLGGIAASILAVKTGWDFASDSISRYAERDEQTRASMERTASAMDRFKVSIGRDLSGPVQTASRWTSELIDKLGSLREAAASGLADFLSDPFDTSSESISKTLADVQKAKEAGEKAGEQSTYMDGLMKADSAVLKRLAGDDVGATEIEALLARRKRDDRINADRKRDAIDPLQQAEALASSAAIEAAMNKKARDDKASAQKKLDDAESASQRLQNIADAERKAEQQDRIRLRKQEAALEIEGVRAAMTRLGGETKLADVMDIRLRTQEKIHSLWNDSNLGAFEKMEMESILKAQGDGEIAALKLNGGITGGRGSVGLGGTTFMQASASSANKQVELLKVLSDFTKKIEGSVSRLAQNGIVATYSN